LPTQNLLHKERVDLRYQQPSKDLRFNGAPDLYDIAQIVGEILRQDE